METLYIIPSGVKVAETIVQVGDILRETFIKKFREITGKLRGILGDTGTYKDIL